MKIKPSKTKNIVIMSHEQPKPTIEKAKQPNSIEQLAFYEAKKELLKLNYETIQNGYDTIDTPQSYCNLYTSTTKKLADNETLRNEFTELVAKSGYVTRMRLLSIETRIMGRETNEVFTPSAELVANTVIADIHKDPTFDFKIIERMCNQETATEVYKKISNNLIETKNYLVIHRLLTSISKDYEYNKIFASELSKKDTDEIAEFAELLKDSEFSFKLLNNLLHDVANFNSEINLKDRVFKEIWEYLVVQNLENDREMKNNPLDYLTEEERVDLVIENKDLLLGTDIYMNYTRQDELTESVRNVYVGKEVLDMRTKKMLAIIVATYELRPNTLPKILEELTTEQILEIETEISLLSLEYGMITYFANKEKIQKTVENPEYTDQVTEGFIKSLVLDNNKELTELIENEVGSEFLKSKISTYPRKSELFYLLEKSDNSSLNLLYNYNFFQPNATQAINYLIKLDYDKAKEIKHLTNTPNKAMELNTDIFGEDCGYDTYTVLDRIISGSLNTQDKEIGLTKSGEEGVQELKRVMKEFKEKITSNGLESLANKGELTQLMSHDLLANQLRSILRIDKSQYHTTTDDLRVIAGHYEARVQNGTQVQLPLNYVNKRVNVKRLDQEAMEKKQVSVDVAKQYEQEVSEILATKNELEGSGIWAVRTLIKEMKQEVMSLEKELSSGLTDPNAHPKKLESLVKLLEKLGNLKEFSFSEYEEVLGKVLEFKPLEKYAKKLLYLMTLHGNPDATGTVSQLNTTANTQGIDTMVEFINHTLKAETWEGNIQDPKLKKKLVSLTRIQSFEAESARLRKVGEAGVFEYEFEPTKGLLMELSGSFSDACWAGIENTSGNYPNISTLVFRKNPGNKHERIVGSCMLIETVAVNGTPLTIIRGVNPLENESFQMVSEDFVDQIVQYVKDINQGSNNQTAIVIDDHQGGSASNRTAIYAELKSRIPKLKQIEVSTADTTFNGYDISNDVYLV
jgi:hypothetical protein